MTKKKQHLLIIGYVWPEPDSSAAGRRMMQLISLFKSAGWEIIFASASAETEHMADLSAHGVEMAHIAINSSDFDDFIQELEPSIVMFDRFVTEEQFGWRVAEHCPDALRLLDTEDLHCLRKARQKAVENKHAFSEEDLLHTDIAKREIASILRSDLSLIISETEIDLLKKVFNIDEPLLYHLPFLLDPVDERVRENWPGFEERQHFVTIGNFRHPPNWDAVLHLKHKIWPCIREELPEAELHVYGAYPSQKVRELHKPDDGFHIKGRAQDADVVVRKARICLVPLRFGAGLKGKLVEAMQCGTPSVTTDIGSEGLQGSFPWPGRVANDIEGFISAAVELYTNKAVWEKAQQNGIPIINDRFSKKNGTDFVDRVIHLKQQLRSHRTVNFTGRMLMHHSMASSKFMSRWIEAKNN